MSVHIIPESIFYSKLSLILGIILLIINFIITIDFLLVAIDYSDVTNMIWFLFDFINNSLGGIFFVIFFVFLSIYVNLLVIVGNIGLAKDFFQYFVYYPIVKNKTYLDSFIVNL